MKGLFILLAAVGVAAAQPQQDEALRKYKLSMEADVQKLVAEGKVLAMNGAMGPTVKGAPYSGVEVTESMQVLADGTRIHNEQQTNVARDGEGRMRRETPEQVTIWDPVANTTYFLDTKSQTGKKGPMTHMVVMKNITEGGQTRMAYHVMTSGDAVISEPPRPPLQVMDGMKLKLEAEASAKRVVRDGGKAESLGQQMVEGVPCEGTRTTMTIEAGTIGNDRPIQIVNERWYSRELQTVVMTKHSDPRTGEETFRLTNVSRSEPPSTLFQAPADYQIKGPKE
jgi:hypothetical protein